MPTTRISNEGKGPLYRVCRVAEVSERLAMVSKPAVVKGMLAPETDPIRSPSARPVCPSGAMLAGASPVAELNKSAHDRVKAGICTTVLQGMVIF